MPTFDKRKMLINHLSTIVDDLQNGYDGFMYLYDYFFDAEGREVAPPIDRYSMNLDDDLINKGEITC